MQGQRVILFFFSLLPCSQSSPFLEPLPRELAPSEPNPLYARRKGGLWTRPSHLQALHLAHVTNTLLQYSVVELTSADGLFENVLAGYAGSCNSKLPWT